ncbi:unnamed protein product [Miscanthus lutarioriparius]|uniref:TFIIS central domain-containing protein n=1 Tax=Miscanthus lutarioriparius TaxID=422564 RepID=A0A811SDQ3_9POAL|nr:unnamed protein product [Miscanthus lutarioriparius]
MIRASPAPSAMGKKVAASPKVQMLQPVPPASKGFVQKGPLLKAHPQLSDSETMRSKFRENLVAALCLDSDQQIVQKSAGNISAFRSACENKHADGDTSHKPSTCITLNEGKADTGTGPKSVGSISEQHDALSGGILGSNMAIKVSKDAQEQSIHVCLENDVSGNSTVASDEFLQHHGPLCAPDIVVGASESISPLNSKRATPSDTDDGATVPLNEPEFKRTKTSDGVTWEQKGTVLKGQALALRIEEDLFKLCGGVSKKYKEKGRSLLFNLKDKSNPVLRGRVLSGEITPKCLCSMTTEELASKELSAWRLAKAEELGKMVVRPNREVNLQRLVRKTHKGEFYVEVEETDSISVGDELRGDLLSHIPSKSIKGRIKSDDGVSVHMGDIEPDNTVQDGFAGIGNSSLLSNLECVANKKTAFILEKVHDMNYTENLPEIMSLDDFVEAPDSDIPLECHSTETAQDDPNFTDRAFHTLKPEKNHIGEGNAAPSEFEFTFVAPSPRDNCQAGIRSPKNGSIRTLSPAKQPKGSLLIKSSPEKMHSEIPDTGCDMQSKAISLWEGTIQLNLSSLINVVAIFKSGEKPSTNEWCHFVEIKGRVRLTAFQDFLEQLPKSRSRAVMVTELRWKEGSHESGRQQFMQTIDSYIADERVGLVKPAKGVELYICPSQGKTAQVLAEHLPKEHSGFLTVTGGVPVIGVFVWRRPHVSTQTPTRHEGSKVQSMPVSRKQQAVIATSVPMSPQLTKPASQFVNPNEHHCIAYDATDDVPPGFGQGVVKDDNDLPVYDCTSISSRSLSPNEAMPYSYRRQQHGQAHSPPMDLVRQLVRKYGGMYDSAQPWDRNHDDLPEWDPSLSGLPYNATQQQPVLPSPLSQVYTLPQEHAMTVQRPWNHRAEALSVQPGWQSRPQWQDIPQRTRLAVEPDVGVPKPTSLRVSGAREPWFGSWKPH